jgi:4-hydroxy-tetrahydrodipicolinate reductase
MKIAIVGHGKMGRLVERVAASRGHSVVARFDHTNNEHAAGLTKANLNDAQVAIEFSTPEALLDNLYRLIELDVPMVVGTTGWYSHLPEVSRLLAERNGALVYGANFSIGMHLFLRLAREAGRLFARYREYDPFLVEHHHKFKKDEPSGTALVITRLLGESYGDQTPVPVSIRAGHAPGTHEIGFDSEADTIRLIHTARSREGFAAGAVLAAEMILTRRGCFEFSELLFGQEEER